MNKITKRFVEEYKAILNLKKIYHFNDVKINIIKEYALSMALVIAVFFGVGLLFHMLESLHYILIVLDILVVGSFVLYKALIEMRFKTKKQLSYSLLVAICFELVYLLAGTMIMNTIVLFMLFNSIVSWLAILTVAVLGSLSMIVYGYIGMWFGHHKIKRTRVLYLGVWMALGQIVLLYLLNIKSITFAYSISFIIPFILLYSKDVLKTAVDFTNKVQMHIYILLLFFTVIYVVLAFDSDKTKTNFTESVPNLVSTNLNIDVNNLFIHDNHCYYQDGNVLDEYDSKMNFIKEIKPDLGDVLYYYFDAQKLKVLILDSNQQEIVANDLDPTMYKQVKQYDITDISNPKLEMEFIYETYNKLIDYQDSFYSLHYYYNDSSLTDLSNQSSVQLLTTNQILSKSKEEVVIYKDGEYRYYWSFKYPYLTSRATTMYYSNDKLIFFKTIGHKGYLMTDNVEDYLDNDAKLALKGSSEIPASLFGFLYSNGYYYLKCNRNELWVYDNKARMVTKINGLYDFKMTDDTLLMSESVNNGSVKLLYIAQLDDLYNTYIVGESKYFDSTALISIMCLLYFLPVKSNLMKLGERHD